MRGRRAQDLSSEGRRMAERMGYHWAKNVDTSLPFEGFMFRTSVMTAVKLMKVRYGLGDNPDIEKKFPEATGEIRSLPLPPHVFRELWVRTQNERMYRRFFILPDASAEIEEVTRDGYRNPHYREAYWKKAPYRAELPLPGNVPHIADLEDTLREGGPLGGSRKTL